MATLERVYVWEVPVRLSHWGYVVGILVLSGTGFYIGNPVFGGSVALMSWMRGIHRIAAWFLVASVLVRTYWALVGNQWASWRVFFPYFGREGRREMAEMFLYYTFLRRRPPRAVGHNALAGVAYSVIVLLLFVEIVTGFALQSLGDDGWRRMAFGWVFSILSIQGVRLLHHLIMWVFLAFAIHHVYSSILVDAEERNGLLSSIFSGYKFIPRRP